MDPISHELIFLLLFAALAGGFIDAIAGGGGLLTVPVLLFAGLTPVQALATNKLQGTFGTFSAGLTFVRSGHIRLFRLRNVIVSTALGAAFGTWLVQVLDTAFLRQVIPLLLIAIAAYYSFSRHGGRPNSDSKISDNAFTLSAAPAIGAYDGFFGPGAGAFYTTSYVVLRGFDLLPATAHTKILNATSNFISLLVFVLGDQVLWTIGLLMGIAQIIGAGLGSRLVIRKGAALIRPMLITVSLLITINLIVRDESHFLHQAIVSLLSAYYP